MSDFDDYDIRYGSATGLKRVVDVANKWLEADPLTAVSRSARSSPATSHYHETGNRGLRGWFDGARGRVKIFVVNVARAKQLATIQRPCAAYEGFAAAPATTLVHCDDAAHASKLVAFARYARRQ